jgi:hypothetical protein
MRRDFHAELRQLALDPAVPVDAENAVALCDLLIFVDQAAEPAAFTGLGHALNRLRATAAA